MKIITLALLLGISLNCAAQMTKSEELGKLDGIPGININKQYSSPIKGLDSLDIENVWSDLKETNYMVEYVMEGNMRKLGYTNESGLKIARIEVFCNTAYNEDTDNPEMGIYSIAVFLQLPKSDEKLSEFYETFHDKYGQTLGATGYREDYELLQWHSSNSCGAMMNLPDMESLKACEENNLEYLELRFVPSCGG